MRPRSRRGHVVRASVGLLLVLVLVAGAWLCGPDWAQPLLLPCGPALSTPCASGGSPCPRGAALPDSPARAGLAPRAPPLT